MRYTHDEIRDMLPDYLNGSLRKDIAEEIGAHVHECSECREEMSILSELQEGMDVPDPGDLFWDTLPQRISRVAAEERKRIRPLEWLFRPVPVMASLLLLMILTFSYILLRTTNTYEIDPLFEDPLAYSSIETNGITEDELLPIIAEEMGINEDMYIEDDDAYSYYIDIASLGPAELDGLLEALQEQTKGG